MTNSNIVFKKHHIILTISIFFASLFLLILSLVVTKNDWLNGIDNSVANFFANNRIRIFDYFFVALSYFAGSKVIAIFCLILLALPNRKKIGIPVSIATGASAVVNLALKLSVKRPRPAGYFLTEPTLFYTMPSSFSFPSGHSQTAIVFFVMLFVCLKKLSRTSRSKTIFEYISISIFCFLICFARIYLAVHFLSDVLAGLSLGILILCLAKSFEQSMAIQKRKISFEYL